MPPEQNPILELITAQTAMIRQGIVREKAMIARYKDLIDYIFLAIAHLSKMLEDEDSAERISFATELRLILVRKYSEISHAESLTDNFGQFVANYTNEINDFVNLLAQAEKESQKREESK